MRQNPRDTTLAALEVELGPASQEITNLDEVRYRLSFRADRIVRAVNGYLIWATSAAATAEEVREAKIEIADQVLRALAAR